MDIIEDDLPRLVDTTRPNVPCMYDFYLGGKLNSAVDREAAQKAMDAAPIIPMIARENRRFLRRSVRFMSEQGVKQFLDIGSGLPTVGNTHEIAKAVNPDAKVVYVDHEPVVKVLGERILASEEGTAVVIESALNPKEILEHPEVLALIDFTRPVGLLMYSVLHFISDEQLPGVLEPLRGALPPGSYLAASHQFTPPTGEWTFDNSKSKVVKDQYKNAATSVTARSLAEMKTKIFSTQNWKMVEPGLVWVPQWRPNERDKSEEGSDQCFMVGAVSLKQEII